MNREEIAAIAELAVENDLIVLADEIYAEILFEGEHVSIATMPGMAERTIILDGFSKTYAMTGWRLGYGAMPADFAQVITKLMVNSNSCTSMAVQRAGLEALTGPQDDVREMVEAFRRRRTLIVDGLNAIDGITCNLPKGAFYVFPNITGTGMSSRDFADYLLQEHGVAGIAGTSFGSVWRGVSSPFLRQLRCKPRARIGAGGSRHRGREGGHRLEPSPGHKWPPSPNSGRGYDDGGMILTLPRRERDGDEGRSRQVSPQYPLSRCRRRCLRTDAGGEDAEFGAVFRHSSACDAIALLKQSLADFTIGKRAAFGGFLFNQFANGVLCAE